MSLIVLDYDETYTEDPSLWAWFIDRAKTSEHTVVICTNRVGDPYVDADVVKDAAHLEVPVVFAATFPNKELAMQDAGYITENAIWIDDRPEWVRGGTT